RGLVAFPTRRSSDLDDHGEGVAVVELDHVDVAERDLRHAEGRLPREHRARGERVGGITAEVSLAHSPEIDRGTAKVPGALGAGQDRKSTRLNSSHQI